MADVNGVQTALVAANSFAEPGCRNSRLRVLQDSYVFPADAFTINNRIKIGTLPKGARVLGGFAQGPSLGTVGKFTLGNDDDADGYVTEIDLGGQAAHTRALGALVTGQRLAEAVDVYLKCTEAPDAAQDDEVTAAIFYSLD